MPGVQTVEDLLATVKAIVEQARIISQSSPEDESLAHVAAAMEQLYKVLTEE